MQPTAIECATLAEKPWLLLLHQIPPKPAYFRAKVLRRLNQIGALAIKNSAYLLPANDDTLEDFQWLRREIEKEGGEAWLFRTDVAAGLSNKAICEAFRALRKPDYAPLIDNARELLEQIRQGRAPAVQVVAAKREELPQMLRWLESAAIAPSQHENEWRNLKRRYEEVRRIDFFDAPEHEELEAIMEIIDHTLHAPSAAQAGQPGLADLKGRTWVTRRGIKVDRISSAWLVLRFIDPAARFRFVDPQSYVHSPGELRFDMFEGEFTHEGDLCSFEVLLARTRLDDPALRAIAEMIHDIDLKDSKYQRNETAGIASLIDGIALRNTEDERRLEEGATVFDALYARLSHEAGTER